MSSLHKLQQDFMASIFNHDDNAALTHIANGAYSNEQRLAIYRNNVYINFTKTLEGVYPVIQRLVGDDFFKFSAHQYINDHPSYSGDLNLYGAQFAEFLAHFPPAAELEYLPDVARLEWAYHVVYSAADHAPLDLDRLAHVSPEDYGNLRFKRNPATQLLASNYPIAKIWQVNQPDHEGDQSVDLAQGGEKLLLLRQNNAITIMPLTKTQWTLLSDFDAGLPLNDVVNHVLDIDPGIDFGELLQHCISASILVDILK